MLCDLCLSRELNPGLPALQVSTLWKEPFEQLYLVAIRDLTCADTGVSMPEPVRYQNKETQSDRGMLQYWTEMMNAGMLIPAATAFGDDSLLR
jgi:hypothetical protein